MVLPASAPHDEVPPREGDWIEPIRRELALSGAQGILIHVDHAVPERLGDLVRGLLDAHPEIDVHTSLEALESAPEGSTIVLVPRREHAGALNLGRPLFSRRKLKAILWCDHETTVALAQNAPDFFDWVSAHHECPPLRSLAAPGAKALSPEHHASARRMRAEGWMAQGRYEEAEQLLLRAMDAQESVLPEDHGERWRTRLVYGRTLFLQGRPEEAEPILRRALALAEQHAGERHPDTGRILAELARVEHRLGRPEAGATARRALYLYEGAQIADEERTVIRGELGPIAATAPASS
jgi:tetratricopeptide (TPR) repeat protein